MKRKIGTLLLLPFVLTACDKKMSREQLEEIINNFSDIFTIKAIKEEAYTSSFSYSYEGTEKLNGKVEKSIDETKIYDRENGIYIEKYNDSFVEYESINKTVYNVIRTINKSTVFLYTYVEDKESENDKIYSNKEFNSFEEARKFLEEKRTISLLKNFAKEAASFAYSLNRTFQLDASKISGTARGNVKLISYSDPYQVANEERSGIITYHSDTKEITGITEQINDVEYSSNYSENIEFGCGHYELPDFSNYVQQDYSLI